MSEETQANRLGDGYACPYCGSKRTIDCGDVGIGTHFECTGCGCGFLVQDVSLMCVELEYGRPE